LGKISSKNSEQRVRNLMVLALMRAYKNVKSLCLKQKPRHDSRKEPMKNGHVYVIVKTKEHFWDFSSARPRDERMYLDECGNKDLSHGLSILTRNGTYKHYATQRTRVEKKKRFCNILILIIISLLLLLSLIFLLSPSFSLRIQNDENICVYTDFTFYFETKNEISANNFSLFQLMIQISPVLSRETERGAAVIAKKLLDLRKKQLTLAVPLARQVSGYTG